MPSSLSGSPFKPGFASSENWPSMWLHVVLVAILTFALSGWSCSAISCLGVSSVPQITSLSPNAISANAQSVLLIVIGNDFDPQSQILWNGNTLPTTFIDSQHLQATVTQQTLAQFGGSQGTNALIAVNSPVSTRVEGCPISGGSATLALTIN